MRLEKYYYETTRLSITGNEATFGIRLLRGCTVYRGHFPGKPVAPGAFNIQTIKECTERLIGKQLHIGTIKRCRFSSVLIPDDTTELEVKVSAIKEGTAYIVEASIVKGHDVSVSFSGVMSEIENQAARMA